MVFNTEESPNQDTESEEGSNSDTDKLNQTAESDEADISPRDDSSDKEWYPEEA